MECRDVWIPCIIPLSELTFVLDFDFDLVADMIFQKVWFRCCQSAMLLVSTLPPAAASWGSTCAGRGGR